MRKIGVIGRGDMGSGMARDLVGAGFEVAGCHRCRAGDPCQRKIDQRHMEEAPRQHRRERVLGHGVHLYRWEPRRTQVSFCVDLLNRRSTEVDLIYGTVIARAEAAGVEVPTLSTLASLVSGLERKYMGGGA